MTSFTTSKCQQCSVPLVSKAKLNRAPIYIPLNNKYKYINIIGHSPCTKRAISSVHNYLTEVNGLSSLMYHFQCVTFHTELLD